MRITKSDTAQGVESF